MRSFFQKSEEKSGMNARALFRLCRRGVLLLCFLGALPLFATDAEAERIYMRGLERYNAGEYREAAGLFEDSCLEAESGAIRANSLLAQIGAWRMCGLRYKEFQAIERLLSEYPEYAGNFIGMVEREFEIALDFCHGWRDPAYWSLRWIPWLTDADKSQEIFETALKRAPFAKQGPWARLHLAYLYQEQGMTKKAMEQLRLMIKQYPESELTRYAYLALADTLFELAKRGDGDGRYIREATEVLHEFERRYTDRDERDWSKRKLIEAGDIQAERLREMADFYRKNGKTDVSNRYLARIVREYPSSTSAVEAESDLAEQDNTFVPGDFPKQEGSRLPQYQAHKIPAQQAQDVLILPGAGGNHYLLPVPDLFPERNTEVKK